MSAGEAHQPQKCFFKACAGKAFTIVLCGFAFATCILPKISRFPALVAGFTRVLILQRPGMVKTPTFFTSVAAMDARLLITLVHCDFLTSVSVANASAIADFVMALPVVFMALPVVFMGGAIL